MNNILTARNLGKEYPLPEGSYPVFRGIDIEVKAKDFVGIMGVSGVGKTTLLNLLGGLDRPSEGKVILEGEDVFCLGERALAEVRNRKIGFVFQFFHLLPEFTAVENVSFPLLIRGMKRKEAVEKALSVLREVRLEEKALLRPSQLSGGEQQRVAVARALVNDPRLLLADEPTGNLDWKTGELVLKLIQDLHLKKGLTSIVVTHNEKVARYCHELYVMDAGRLKRSPLL